MKRWMNVGDTLGPFRCITLMSEEKEKCLSGRRGDIWEYGKGMYKAVVFLPSGQEKIYTFKSKQLGSWIIRLEVPSNPSDQLLFANNFGQVV